MDVSQMLMIKTARLANRVRRVEEGDQSSRIPMLPQTREEFKAVYEKMNNMEDNMNCVGTWNSLPGGDGQSGGAAGQGQGEEETLPPCLGGAGKQKEELEHQHMSR